MSPEKKPGENQFITPSYNPFNRLAWNGKAGHYEVWYLTFNHADRGYWIRTTLRVPLDGPAEGALWFLEFVPGQTPRAWKEPIPPPEGPYWSGKAGLASWDLTVRSDGTLFRPIPALLRGFVGTKIVTPHLDARVSGTLRIAGEEIRLEDARGCQSHLWGKAYGVGWAWVHANFDGGVLEGIAGKKPALIALHARLGNRRWNLHTLLASVRNRSLRKPSPEGWRFCGTSHNRELVGSVTCDPKHLAGVTYVGPAGERIYCYNTEIAEIKLELRARAFFGTPWTVVANVSGPAHYEIAGREPLPGLSLLVT